MARVRVSARAERDLEDGWLYIARDSPAAADRFLDKITRTCAKIADTPGMGRERSELAENLHSFPVGTFVIFYRQESEGIAVARVLSGYRDIDAIFDIEG